MDIADIRNHLYDRAERHWLTSLLLGLGVQVVFASTTVIQNATFTITTSTILFFIPIATRWIQEKSKNDTLKALRCRLAILYSDAFNESIPTEVLREINSWAGMTKLSKAPFKKPYYDSKLTPGPNRLADIVSESAFWTYNLANDMRWLMSFYTGIYLVSALTLVYFLFQINLGAGILVIAAKIVIAMVSFVFTSEALMLIIQYNELYLEAKRIYGDTAKLALKKRLKVSEIMQIVEGYNILLISSPTLPSRLYKFKQNSLNKAYKAIMSNK